VSEHYGWDQLFVVFAAAGLLAAAALIPLWNLKPSDQAEMHGVQTKEPSTELATNL